MQNETRQLLTKQFIILKDKNKSPGLDGLTVVSTENSGHILNLYW